MYKFTYVQGVYGSIRTRTRLLLLMLMLWHKSKPFSNRKKTSCLLLNAGFEAGKCETPNRQQTEWPLTNRLSYRGSSKNLNSTARPYDEWAFSPLDFTADCLWHLAKREQNTIFPSSISFGIRESNDTMNYEVTGKITTRGYIWGTLVIRLIYDGLKCSVLGNAT